MLLNQVHKQIKITRKDSISFIASGYLDYPSPFKIFVANKKASRTFYLQAGNNFLTTSYDSLYTNHQVIGSEINNIYITKYLPLFKEYQTLDREWYRFKARADDEYKGNIPLYVRDSISKARKTADSLKDHILSLFVKENKGSYLSLWKLNEFFVYYGFSDLYFDAYSLLSKKIRNSYDGRLIGNRLKSGEKLANGKIFPDLKLINTDGRQVSLRSNIIGGYTLIDFWYSNCYPCLQQIPHLSKIRIQFNKLGFEIIGVSTDKFEDFDKWIQTIKSSNANWVNLLDESGTNAAKLVIEAFPTNFLVNSRGEIVQRNISPEELELFLIRKLQ